MRLQARQNDKLFRNWEVAGLVFLILAICVGLASFTIRNDLRNAREVFSQQTFSYQREIDHRFASADAVLTALVGLHHASVEVEPREFTIMSRDVIHSYPHIRRILKLTVLDEDERETLEQQMHDSGYPAFRLHGETAEDTPDDVNAAGQPAVMIPVVALEPWSAESEGFIGYNALSDPAMSAPIRRAISSGRAIGSDVLEVPGLGRGFFVFKAVYSRPYNLLAGEATFDRVTDVVGLFLDPDQFFNGISQNFGSFTILSSGDANADTSATTQTFRQVSSVPRTGVLILDPFVVTRQLKALGREFSLTFSKQPGLEMVRGWFVGFLVVLPSIAGGFLILALANHRRRQRQAREDRLKLRLNEERSRDFAEVGSDWFWEMDDQLRFSFLSSQITEATGLKPEEAIGRTRAELADHEVLDEKWQKHLEDMAAHRPFRDFRYKRLSPRGRSGWTSISGKPVFDENGRFAGYRGTGRNVTGEVEAQAQLLQAKEEAELASRSKSAFLANMSHELRTPLNAIIGFSDLMLGGVMGKLENQRYREYVEDISEAGQHLLSIINEILDLAKVESGSSPLQEENIDVSEAVRSVLSLVTKRINESQITLQTDISAELPLLWADGRKLKQILVNLISNAVKFTPAHGTITLQMAFDPQMGFVFKVRDTGIGIAAEDIPKALVVFQQIDSELSRKYEGTGLGLPLAKAYAELHGGLLVLKSELGKGTEVTVTFPPERAATGVMPNAMP